MTRVILILFIVLNFGFILCDEFNIIRNIPTYSDYHNLEILSAVCITDNNEDAIIWNTYLNSEITINRRIADEDDSFKILSQYLNSSQWNLAYNLEIPMGPVFDSRWEMFEEYHTLHWDRWYYHPIAIKKNGINNKVFGGSGALTVSIRAGANGHILICNSSVHYSSDSFCYWVLIGGWDNTISGIRRCPNGVPKSFPKSSSPCYNVTVPKSHSPLNIHEWKTYVITWKSTPMSIKVYDPEKILLNYTDYNTRHKTNQDYYLFFGNPDRNYPTKFRIHEYNYTLTNQPGAQLVSQLLNIQNKHNKSNICIDMFVGLCATCELHVSLIDNDGQQVAKEIFSGLKSSQRVQHNLPMWQYARISASNIRENYESLSLEIITESPNGDGNHWAVDHIKECAAEETVRKLTLTPNLKDRNGYFIWPDVTCQRLSYNNQHSEIISSSKDVTRPPNNLKICPRSRIGPKCLTPCELHFNIDCQSVTICDQNGCYCSQGHHSADCSMQCSGYGEYGYGCAKQCNNCHNSNCTIFTGLCMSGCKKLNEKNKHLVEPYCNDVIESPELLFDQINETTLRVYFPEIHHDKKFLITYTFEMLIDQTSWLTQNAEFQPDNETVSKYFTVFDKLQPGMKYRARVSQRLQYKSINKMEDVHVYSELTKPTIMCIWTTNFEVDVEDKNLTVTKIDNSTTFPCPNDWYTFQLLLPLTNDNDYETIKATSADGNFPIIVENLEPITYYIISITGRSTKFQFRQEVITLASKPSKVRDLKANNVTSTEVFVTWLPPKTAHGMLLGYNLSIKALHYEGCSDSTATDSSLDRSFILGNFTESYLISDLVPYVAYELTVFAYHSRNGKKNSIEFLTKATEIPTSKYEYAKYKNNKIEWSFSMDNCTTITGPIRATRLIFFGESVNIKNFSDFYDTENHSFTVSKSRRINIYGNEQYRVQVHPLRVRNGTHNESVYNELNFITDPLPPPKVRNLTIVEVDTLRRTTLLRWMKPLPPTNGEIIEYSVSFVGENDISEEIIVFPNETCPLWEDSLCKLVTHPHFIRNEIQVCAVNKDVYNCGAINEIKDQLIETASDPPGKISTFKLPEGIIDLNWEHPFITGGPMKQFLIECEFMSTRLKELRIDDREKKTIPYQITNYKKLYNTTLNLLPSTRYKIYIKGIVETQSQTLIGQSSDVTIETISSFAWFQDNPNYTVNNDSKLITLSLPTIVNDTENRYVEVVAIGQLKCQKTLMVDENLARDIGLKNDEIAWHIGTFMNLPLSITIGGDINVSDCQLYVGYSYTIVIAVREDNITKLEWTQPLIWRSRSIQIGSISGQHHEIWAIPLVLLIIVLIISLIYYLTRKKKRKTTGDNKLFVDISNPMKSVSETLKITKKKSPCSLSIPQRPDTVEYRESIMLTPAVSHEQLKPIPINEEAYEKIKCNSLVKLNEFQDYVKRAIASGKLNEQYSIFPRGQTKPWEYGSLPENKRKNRYGNLIAYDETRVILEKLPDDPYSDYINANYIKGYKKNRAYIATQGPKPTTVIDFWRMVWQEHIQVICMLANVMEGGKTKCEKYWPEIGKVMKYGNISVSNISHVQFADYTFRIFHLKCDQETRKIDHLHYTAWPDHAIPLYTQSVVTYLKKLLATPSGSGPVLVHCSAGVGRTGTIILCDICLRRAAAEGVVDVFGETEEIRQQRANMVDNKQQYILAHVALVECLLSLPTAIPCNDSLPLRIQEYKSQLSLQQQRLEQSAWQDEALQSSERLQLKLSEKNMAKNRFPNLLPSSRLYISRYPTTDDDSSYIFGVYVDSARRQNNFIASQIPLPTTVNDFWRMVAELKVQLIVILQPPDPEDPTCCKFVPEPDEEISPLTFLNVKGKTISDGKHCTQQKITLIDNSTKSPREQPIIVLTCKEWDPGRNKSPPEPEALVDLWQMAERISRSDEPTVVLCHDGVTGCGLYLALSFLLERMGLEHECDVCFAIRAIRRSRSDFCQTREQFEYLYDAAVIYAGYFETYANFT